MRELKGLMAGGTGGRAGARNEDQAAENGWRGIGTLYEHPVGSPRLRGEGDAAASPQHTPSQHKAQEEEGVEQAHAQEPTTVPSGNRIVDVGLLAKLVFAPQH